MRQRKADLRGRVNGNVSMEFTEHSLTSYSGLELLIRYLRNTGLNRLVRKHLAGVVPGKDFGVVAFCRVILGLLIVGGRRLRHIEFLKGDPLFERFCGLRQLPTDRTVSRWLKNFRIRTVRALKSLNAEMVAQVVKSHLPARTLTIDVDGTVISTGLKVAGHFEAIIRTIGRCPATFPSVPFWRRAVTYFVFITVRATSTTAVPHSPSCGSCFNRSRDRKSVV